MSEVKVNKISPRSGTAFTLGDSGDTFTVPSGATLTTTNATVNLPASVGGLGTGIDVTSQITGVVPTANLGSGSASSSTFLRGDQTYAAAGGVDTIWELTKDGDQTVTDNTLTQLTTWTAVTDTGSAWDNTNNKIIVPSGKAGKYLITATIYQEQSSGGNTYNDTYTLALYKEGSAFIGNTSKSYIHTNSGFNYLQVILDLAELDEIKLYSHCSAGGGTTIVTETCALVSVPACTWSGARLAS
jgi:hypothetical protein